VVGALFVIIAALALRANGSELLSRMGGIATRAPVLAGLFLVTALATLAMPGSANFVAELYILFGAFEDKFAYGVVASLGVVLAAVYMIRMYIRSMHNQTGPEVESFDTRRSEFALIAPLVAIVIALGLFPNFVLERTEADTARPHPEVSVIR
jgi:NADH-quinone oxidoreductase subunit M